MSRALGMGGNIQPMGYNRYEGVGDAIRMARALSKENLQHQPVMERGPCPRDFLSNRDHY
jgi:hypothetical protein